MIGNRKIRVISALCLLFAGLLSCLPASADDRQPIVALTFDDGPHPGRTGRILDVLAKYGVKATFFVLGCNADYYPGPMERAALEGHEIENHSFDHKMMGKCEEEMRESIRKTEERILKLTGKKPTYFRPPEGRSSPELLRAVNACGYKQVFWDVDSEDWRGKPYASIVRDVLNSVKDGDVILFHDYVCPGENTKAALETIIPALQKRGFRFVTISELIGETGDSPKCRGWFSRTN